MLDVFIFESNQLLESLEDVLLQGEKERYLDDEQINEIFRIMHTIKGSAAMMQFEGLSKLAHAVEDLFAQIREKKARRGDWAGIFEIVLTAGDNLKADVAKLSAGQPPDADHTALIDKIHNYLEQVSKRQAAPEGDNDDDFIDPNTSFYKIKLTFEPDCQMENMRAFGAVTALTPHCQSLVHKPADLMTDTASDEIIADGFVIYVQSAENPDVIKDVINEVMFLQASSILPLMPDNEEIPASMRPKIQEEKQSGDRAVSELTTKQNFISVNVNKLDKLMDLVGEIVTTESMVTKNPEITNLHLESFERSGQQLRKLINELQDIVMSIRMLPVSTTFQKMHRIVRDVSKKVSKEVELVIIGEETEVDKNIIDTLSDPLMHLIRNAVDHGIEHPDERLSKGKPASGRITLEARNSGGDVMIIISDDGQGLDRTAIIKKAIERGLTSKADHEISDKEAYGMIFLPGFSTNEVVTEFSGRGVGMDVVRRNIDKVGGSISIDSTPDVGMNVQIRIPLTLAIIDGMRLRVGKLDFIVPMLSIQESFKPSEGDVFLDPDGSELIMIRGECYPVMRLYRIFDIVPDVEHLYDGILIMLSTDTSTFCLFVDELIGEQQAVIKPLPEYIQKHNTGMHGVGGCAVLGDGSISLIIDINSLVIE